MRLDREYKITILGYSMNLARETDIVRVLIMDDERCIRESTKLMLESSGFRVDGARDGREAILLFSRAIAKGFPYRVVLLDLTIKRGEGAEVTLSVLKELDPEIATVLISGYHYSPPMRNPKKHGFCAALRKPYAAIELRDTIERLITIPTS